MPHGLDANGFTPKSEAEILQSLQDGLDARLGLALDRGAESTVSRLLGAYARVLAEGWSAADALWQSGWTTRAAGVRLDDLVAVTGVARLPATRSIARVICVGREGTELPAGRVVNTERGARFASVDPGVLTASLWQGRVVVARVVPNTRLRLTIDGQSAEAVAALGDTPDSVAGRLALALRGLTLPLLISTARGGVVELTATDLTSRPNAALTVEPAWTGELRLTAVSAGQTYSALLQRQGFPVALGITVGSEPPVAATILANLGGMISTPTTVFDAEIAPDGLALQLRHRQPGGVFTMQVSGPLSPRDITPDAAGLASFSTRLLPAAELRFDAESTGPVQAPALALDRIATPVAGWERAFNPRAADEGRTTESDADLRTRQRRSLQVPGTAVRESIAARLRQDFPEARAVRVVENDADTPDADGRPPHSYEVLIDIARDADIDQRVAEAIERCRPAGIRTVSTRPLGALPSEGGVRVDVVDFQGQLRPTWFTRPELVLLHIVVQVHRHPDLALPAEVREQVRAALVELGRGLNVGQDFVPGRVLHALNAVPGLGRAALAWHGAGWPSGAPVPTEDPVNWSAIPGAGILAPLPIASSQRCVIDPQNVVVQVFP